MDARQIRREIENAGGAYILRPCCGRQVGEVVSRAELQAMKPASAIALIKQEKLRPFFVAPEGASLLAETTRFAIHRGCGKYDVIEGVKLNTEQLSKAEAESLVAQGAAKH